MERRPAVVWTCLLGVGLTMVLPGAFSKTTSNTIPRPPQLINCTFLQEANVTCRWEAGGSPATSYTLTVEKMPTMPKSNSSLATYTCTTSKTSCTASLEKSDVRFNFCISITAHSHNQDISSPPRCQSGRDEVMLPPVKLESVNTDRRDHRCLLVNWDVPESPLFPVSRREIGRGHLNSQIELTTQGQTDTWVENVTVRNKTCKICSGRFRPDASYTIRLRHRYMGPQSPWSPWSNASEGMTAEDTPSAAPVFWRRVEKTEQNGSRHVSLLWKPLPHFLANGKVNRYSVTCEAHSLEVLDDHGGCRDLNAADTSCSLHLPAGRCSCYLTASTSAGTSPKAHIQLLGAFETEPPPPMNITVTPLDDNSLDVRWAALADWSPSGFVVEWFAVSEKNSNVTYWEKLNSSCRALVITEGIKPKVCYAVSVKALYEGGGVGQNETVVYTRQGAPSAGPKVHVQKISGSTVELTWSPVPVEELHGFIRSYVLSYSRANQSTKSVVVPADRRHHTLTGLSPGNYNISLQAVTDAGAGPAGNTATAHIGSEETSILTYALVPLLLTSLVLIGCVGQSARVKQKLCQDVPDPSNSSVAHWIPKTNTESSKWPAPTEKAEIKYSEVFLLSESEPQDWNPDKDLSYQSLSNLQTYSSHGYSPFSAFGTQTLPNTRKPEMCIQTSTRAKTTSGTDLSSSPSVYTNILLPQTLKHLPPPVPSTSYLKLDDWQLINAGVNDVKVQPGGASEPFVPQGRSDSPLCQTDELKTFSYLLRQHQSTVSSNSSSISLSSCLFSHPAEVTPPQQLFSQSLYKSVPSLQPDTLTHPEPVPDTLTTSLSTFPNSVFVDFSYCRLDWDQCIVPGN